MTKKKASDHTWNSFRAALLKRCRPDNQTWKRLTGLFSERTLPPRAFFALEGERPLNFGFVTAGCLRMYNLTDDGRDLSKHFFLPGEFMVGAIHPGQSNTVSIQALTDCSILSADYQKLDHLSETTPAILEFKMKLIAEFVEMKQKRENNYLSMDGRARYELFLREYPCLIDRIQHYHIAGYLGVTPTQLSRIRKK